MDKRTVNLLLPKMFLLNVLNLVLIVSGNYEIFQQKYTADPAPLVYSGRIKLKLTLKFSQEESTFTQATI